MTTQQGSLIVSLFGITASIVYLVWDRHKFRALQRQRDEDKAEMKRQRQESMTEKVQCFLGNTIDDVSGYTLTVRIVNQRDFTIPIKGVALIFQLDKVPMEMSGDLPAPMLVVYRSLSFKTPVPILQTKGRFAGLVTDNWRESIDLAPRNEVSFCLSDLDVSDRVGKNLKEMSPDQIYISIQSPSGEIDRIDGHKVLDWLTDFKPESPSDRKKRIWTTAKRLLSEIEKSMKERDSFDRFINDVMADEPTEKSARVPTVSS
jgi:hypothetical protein